VPTKTSILPDLPRENGEEMGMQSRGSRRLPGHCDVAFAAEASRPVQKRVAAREDTIYALFERMRG
jgi:hypothetical protein